MIIPQYYVLHVQRQRWCWWMRWLLLSLNLTLTAKQHEHCIQLFNVCICNLLHSVGCVLNERLLYKNTLQILQESTDSPGLIGKLLIKQFRLCVCIKIFCRLCLCISQHIIGTNHYNVGILKRQGCFRWSAAGVREGHLREGRNQGHREEIFHVHDDYKCREFLDLICVSQPVHVRHFCRSWEIAFTKIILILILY